MRAMAMAAPIAAAMILAGCVRQLDSNFTPIGKNKYDFNLKATWEMPADSQQAEKTRLQWLDSWMAENQACPNGYRVASRQLIDEGLYSRIHYIAECNS